MLKKNVVQIMDQAPNASVVVMKLDLASLASIHDFANEFLKSENRLDILINNAGNL